MISPTGIWSAEEAVPANYPFSALLCFKLIFKVFNQSEWVYDLGCGDGYYLRHLLLRKFSAMGFDGFVRPDCDEHIFQRDLTELFFLPKWGQILSLEVGEHIPRQYEQCFIDNLCNNCSSRMVISWAIEGQGGIGHVNCRNNGYVIEQIEKRGFKFNIDLTSYLRADIEMGVNYFKNTLMVFDRINL